MDNIYRNFDEIERLLSLVDPKSEVGENSLRRVRTRMEELKAVMCPKVREDLIERVIEVLSQWTPGTVFTTLDVYERLDDDEPYAEVVSVMREMYNREMLGERKLITIPPKQVGNMIIEQIWQYTIGEGDEIDT